MNEHVKSFFERLEEDLDRAEAEDVEQLLESVQEVFASVLGEGFERIDMLVDTDEESLSLYLRDIQDIADYELFTIHSDGTFEPHFRLETSDYHRDTFGFGALEDNPDNWFASRFEDPAEIPWSAFREQQSAFVDELTGWFENFCVDMETVYETDEELVEVEKRSNLDHSQEARVGAQLDELL